MMELFVTAQATIIPSTQRITWTPGIDGGIPNITSPVVNVVTDYGADSSGTSDSHDAIQSAINSLGSGGGVVYIPHGTYKINGSLKLGYNGIVLRGDGPDKTKLYFYDPTTKACIEVLYYGRGDWQGVSGYTKDTTTLTVDDGSQFTVGEFAEIQQVNDPEVMYTDPKWDQSWAANAVGQLLEVTAVNGNEVSFKTALHIDFSSSLDPQIRPQRFVTNSGIEDLYIEMKTNTDVSTILIKNSAYCWVRNIESYHTKRCHVAGESAIGIVVRDSYFHRSYDYGGGGHGYGVSLGLHCTDWLVENNSFDSLRHAMMTHIGANGNVFGYNYSQNILQGDGETDLNEGWEPPDISLHGHYSFMNLYEGNSVNEVGISDYWGPSGPGNTIFRNLVKVNESHDGISYHDHSQYQNVIGNSCYVIRDADNNSSNNLEHGNVIDGTVVWDSNISDRNLPNSYYLTSKPDFLDSISWPVYGPDVGFSQKLPAQSRLESSPVFVQARTQRRANDINIYPNPFNTTTTITVNSISDKGVLKIYNTTGELIKSYPVDQTGLNKIVFHAERYGRGVYFVIFLSDGKIVAREKMILLR